MIQLHRDTYTGLYHANPESEVQWVVHDTRGYIDGGPSCDTCGDCECDDCPECDATLEHVKACLCAVHNPDGTCVGLSVAYICLDGRDALCEDCAQKEGLEIVSCDCE